MKIDNLNIYGGQIQFADMILNNSSILDQTDSKFLQLIHEHTESPIERAELVKNLEKIKSESESEPIKKKAGDSLKEIFKNEAVKESTKILVKEIFEQGAAYLSYIL